MDILNWLMDHTSDIVNILLSVLALASLVTGLTSTPKDDKLVSKIRLWVKRLSVLTHKDAPGTFKLPG